MKEKELTRVEVDPVRVDVDVAFVGSGAATTFTLLALLEQWSRRREHDRPLHTMVFDYAPEPFYGIPYGPRSGVNALTITPLRDFLPEPKRALYRTWLIENKSALFDMVVRSASVIGLAISSSDRLRARRIT